MKTRSFLAILLVMFTFALSCKKSSNDPAPGGDCTQANITARSNAYTAAVTTYANSPTTANCKAVVTAYDAYLAVAQNCSFVTKAQVEAIQKARADLASSCN
ncbi:hypothetical protein GCM10028807_57090 [Spirosoma daeguense]